MNRTDRLESMLGTDSTSFKRRREHEAGLMAAGRLGMLILPNAAVGRNQGLLKETHCGNFLQKIEEVTGKDSTLPDGWREPGR
jgi:hypothetical protein